MSSPRASLKKTRKSPLPSTKRSVPFRQHQHKGPLVDQQLQSVLNDRHPHRAVKGSCDEAVWRPPNDTDMVSLMATRLAQVEAELKVARKTITDKEAVISRLEDELAVLRTSSRPEAVASLQQQCCSLQQQIDDMEEFLNDYGMVWVGKEGSSSDVWVAESSRVANPFTVNFDKIVKNIEELNLLAGEHGKMVQYTSTGAQLKAPELVPLTLYSNGMIMFNGPFRPYSEPSTQECLQDISDGYFPSELKQRYPNGVPFKLTDERGTEYNPSRHNLFPGPGLSLTSEASRSGHSLTPQLIESKCSQQQASNPPPLTMEAFLSKIPRTVVKGGRVIDIHSGLTETLKGPNGRVTLVDTPTLQEITERLDCEGERPPTPGRLVTLRVKSEDGSETFILKMRQSDNIAEVRRLIDKQRTLDSESTLKSCGLQPSATLFLTRAHNS